MALPRHVVVFVGSLRQESFSRKIARTLMALAPPPVTCDIAEIGHLSHYNQDLDTDAPPQDWAALRDRVRKADGVLFVTPEYNRSVPGVLKNAIDIVSRPYGRNAFDGKPGAVVSVSPGAIGAFGANHHLRQSLAYLNVPTMAQPEAYVGGVQQKLDAQGNVSESATRDFLAQFMQAFAAWIERFAAPAKQEHIILRASALLSGASYAPGPLDTGAQDQNLMQPHRRLSGV